MKISASFRWIILGCAASIGLRLWAASVGWNYDMESWDLVSGIGTQGKMVYGQTPRYNYGPVFFGILTFVRYVLELFHFYTIQHLHIVLALILAGVDIGIFYFLRNKWKRPQASWLVLFLPANVLISGYHIQFDNLAILIGLWGWHYISHGVTFQKFALGCVLFGFSLATKHVLMFLPISLLFFRFWDLKRKAVLILISYSIFLFLVLGMSIFSEGGLEPIINQVFKYTSQSDTKSILPIVFDFFIPQFFTDVLFEKLPFLGGYKLLFLGMLIVSVGLFAFLSTYVDAVFFVYLLALVGFTSGFADQYLIIPMAAIVYFPFNFLLAIYAGITSVYLIFISTNNIGRYVMEFIGLPYQIILMDAYRFQIYLVLFLAFLFFQKLVAIRWIKLH